MAQNDTVKWHRKSAAVGIVKVSKSRKIFQQIMANYALQNIYNMNKTKDCFITWSQMQC